MRGSWWRPLLAAGLACGLSGSVAAAQLPGGALRGILGANKPDLVAQYLGTASSADGSPAARAVTTAMARKAIADAADMGFAYLRVMAAGYGPSAPPPAGNPLQNDLVLWQTDPPAYWARLDAMFDDLDAAGMRIVPSFVWNPAQFPALARETMAELIANPASVSRALLVQYVGDFVTRYRTRRTVLFYELTNELNLEADLDVRARCLAALPAPNCAAFGNFTSAQLTVFATQLVRQIKALDPSRPVGSGYALPRPASWHLAAQPDFSPRGPDWTPDTPEQFRAILGRLHAPFDLWSVHVYPGDVRWGNPAGTEGRTLQLAASFAASKGRRLYLGECGDSTNSPYLRAMLGRLGSGGIAYGSVWVWEFYQQSTWQSSSVTSSPPMSLEPGFSAQIDAIDAVLARLAGGAGAQAPPAARVVLTAPLPGAILTGPTELYATASAFGPVPVQRVVFKVDGVPVGTATVAPYHVSYQPRTAGPHDVAAFVYAGAAVAVSRASVTVAASAVR